MTRITLQLAKEAEATMKRLGQSFIMLFGRWNRGNLWRALDRCTNHVQTIVSRSRCLDWTLTSFDFSPMALKLKSRKSCGPGLVALLCVAFLIRWMTYVNQVITICPNLQLTLPAGGSWYRVVYLHLWHMPDDWMILFYTIAKTNTQQLMESSSLFHAWKNNRALHTSALSLFVILRLIPTQSGLFLLVGLVGIALRGRVAFRSKQLFVRVLKSA